MASTTRQLLTATLISGSKRAMNAAGVTTASNTKASQAALAVAALTVQMTPEATTSASASVPAAGTAWNNIGWESALTADALGDAGVTQAVTVPVILSWTSGTAGSIGFTVILYLGGAEIGRGTLTTNTTTAAAPYTVNVTVNAGVSFSAGAKIGMAVYAVLPINVGINAVTYTLNYGTSATTGTNVAPFTYTINASRTASDAVARPVESALRVVSTRRTAADVATANVSDGGTAGDTPSSQSPAATSSPVLVPSQRGATFGSALRFPSANAGLTFSLPAYGSFLTLDFTLTVPAYTGDGTSFVTGNVFTSPDVVAIVYQGPNNPSLSMQIRTDVNGFTSVAAGLSYGQTYQCRLRVTNTTMQLYVDGELVNSTNLANPLYSTGAQVSYLGRAQDQPLSNFASPGAILDDLRLSNVARSDAATSAVPLTKDASTVAIFNFDPVPSGVSRVVAYARVSAEVLAAMADSASRSAIFSPIATDITLTTDVATRSQSTFRRDTDAVPTMTDTASRVFVKSLTATDSLAVAVMTPQPKIIYGRNAQHYFVPTDPPLLAPTKSISGVLRDQSGLVWTTGTATVLLLRDSDNLVCSSVTPGADGAYSFPRNSYDPETYHLAGRDTKAGMPYQDISAYGLVPQ